MRSFGLYHGLCVVRGRVAALIITLLEFVSSVNDRVSLSKLLCLHVELHAQHR